MCLTRGSLLLRLHCDDSLVGLFHREIKLLCLLSLPVLWAVVSVSELFFRTLFFLITVLMGLASICLTGHQSQAT